MAGTAAAAAAVGMRATIYVHRWIIVTNAIQQYDFSNAGAGAD